MASKNISLIVLIMLVAAGLFYAVALRAPTSDQVSEPAGDQGEAPAATACRNFNERSLTVNGELIIPVAVADAPHEKTAGLSGCEAVPDGHGMYFVFDQPQSPAFWMKGMLIPIDIIWVAGDRVVGIQSNIPTPQPNQDIEQYPAPELVTAVLEMGAGQAAANGIQTGSSVKLNK